MASIIEVISDIVTNMELDKSIRDTSKSLFERMVFVKLESALKTLGIRDENAKAILQALRKSAFESIDKISAEKKIQATLNQLKDGKPLLTKDGQMPALIREAGTQVSRLVSTSESFEQLAYLSTGLAVADLAIDAAGFAIVISKIDALDEKISKMAATVDKIFKMKVNDIKVEYHKLNMRFNSFVISINGNTSISLSELDRWLIDTEAFIRKLILDFQDGNFDRGIILEMIFNLLPAYTGILNTYVREYYFQHKKHFGVLNPYTDIYNALVGDGFINCVNNYLFVEESLSVHKTIEAVQTQKLLTLNSPSQVVDQLELLDLAGSKDHYYSFIHNLNEVAKQTAKAYIPGIAKSLDISELECNTVIDNAFTSV